MTRKAFLTLVSLVALAVAGTIPPLDGVLPNSIFHVFAGLGFAFFALRIKAGVEVRNLGG